MERSISRRSFLRGSAALAGLVEAVYATRIFQPGYSRNTIPTNAIDKSSEDLAKRISIQPALESSFKFDGKTFKPTFNKKNIAKTLLNMAYLEGGLNEYESTKTFLLERGIFIKENEDITTIASVQQSLGKSHPIILSFGRNITSDYMAKLSNSPTEYIIWHEFYHIIQQARNPQGADASLLAKALIYLGVFPIYFATKGGKFMHNLVTGGEPTEFLSTRRSFLAKIAATVGVVVSLPLGAFYAISVGAFIWPDEMQAYIQGGGQQDLILKEVNWSGILTNKLPDDLRGSLLSFQEVRSIDR